MLMVMMHVECGDLRRIDENERRVALFEEKAAPLLSHEPHPPTHAAVQLWASCSLVFCLVGWVNLCRFCHLRSPLERVVLFKRWWISVVQEIVVVVCSHPCSLLRSIQNYALQASGARESAVCIV